jgi:hypothetical protein
VRRERTDRVIESLLDEQDAPMIGAAQNST